ncbi:MAG: hypothetical protein K2N23_01255 [Clostridia bacterium]|nr:hypothetical protein [Clostridia bacterium]
MILVDWIVLGLIAVFCLLGMLFGFGKGLKFFTGGIFGIIISIVVCYALGGLIYNFGFVQDGLNSMRVALANKGNGFCNFLLKIHIDVIVYYVALFIAVTIIRLIIVRVIKSIVEIDNPVLIVLNKTFGVILFVCVGFMLMLFVFWIISLIGGNTEANFLLKLSGSKLKIDWLFEHNPFMTIIKIIKIRIEVPVT